jgi:hypothetical protein
MTTHTHRSTSRPAPPRLGKPLGIPKGHYITRDHTITGTTTQLANLVTNHRNAGTLIAMTAPRPVADNRLQVVIRLREFQPARPARPSVRVTPVGKPARVRHSRRTRIAVIVTAITATIAGLVTVAAYLLGQLVELITTHAHLILGVLALAAILATAAARRSSSGRRHCPGC